MRFLERLIVPLFIITAAIGLTYWYWTTTPSYALNQVATSIKNRDVDSFQKYVDIDSIASHAIDDILRGPARSSIFGRFDSMIGAGIIGLFKPELIDIIKEQVLHFIAEGNLTALRTTPGLQAGAAEARSVQSSRINITQEHVFTVASNSGNNRPRRLPGNLLASAPDDDDTAAGNRRMTGTSHGAGKIKRVLAEYGFSKEGFKGVEYLKTEGPLAFFALKFHSPKLSRDFLVEFKMEDVGGFWRVTELSNLNDLVSAYLDSRGS